MPNDFPDWSAPASPVAVPKAFEVSINANSFVALVAAVVGVQHYWHTLYSYVLSIPANSKYRVRDNSLNGSELSPGPPAGNVAQNVDARGSPLTAGQGIYLVNEGTAAGDFWVGVLVYS